MPCSFKDALGLAGFCCGGSGTGLQKAAVCKSISCDLPAIGDKGIQQDSANKHYQILWFPQRDNFSEVIIQRQTLLPQVVRCLKTCSNSKQASKQLPGSEIIDVCCTRSCMPNVLCKNSRNAATVRGSPSAPGSQRDTGDFWSFSSI